MTFVWILAALLLLCVLIFVHECGHFLLAKALGCAIDEFAVGFGPKLYSRLGKDGVRYSIRALPLGGFCRFFSGEQEGQEKTDKIPFQQQAAWRRLLVLLAGPAFNIAFALLLAVLLVGNFGIRRPEVLEVLPGGAAEQNGLMVGDTIQNVDGKEARWNTVAHLIAQAPAEGFVLQIRRAGQKQSLRIQNAYDMQAEKNKLGITFGARQEKLDWQRILPEGAALTAEASTEILRAIGNIIARPAEMSQQMMGPIGTVGSMGEVLNQGFSGPEGAEAGGVNVAGGLETLLQLSILLSVNLGVFNLIPVPGLDGGQMVFTLIEMMVRRPIPQHIQSMINLMGIALLLLLSVYLSIGDIGSLLAGGRP